MSESGSEEAEEIHLDGCWCFLSSRITPHRELIGFKHLIFKNRSSRITPLGSNTGNTGKVGILWLSNATFLR